jgi:hypothetical protein
VLLPLILVFAAELPSAAEASILLERHARGEAVNSIGPIQLAGFNFSRSLRLNQQRSALVVSTLWDSGILLFDAAGKAIDVLKTGEVLRVWTADLDGDGKLEVLTEERLIRGTGIELTEFRLYSGARRLRRLWRAEGLHYRDAAWNGVAVDRQSFVRIISGDGAPFLQYRYPCGARECIRRVVLSRGGEVEETSWIRTR